MNPKPRIQSRATLASLREETNLPWLEETTSLLVRFNEVDALRIVWHGHYVNYFEEARRAFGRRYGVDYAAFMDNAVAAPVVQLAVDYYRPARLTDTLEVTARLFKTEAAKLFFKYEIRGRGESALLAAGSTVQVFTTLSGELLLTWPPFVLERLNEWEPLWKHPQHPAPPR